MISFLSSLGPRTRLSVGLGAVGALGLFAVQFAGPDAVSQESPAPPVVSVASPLIEEMAEWSEHSGRFVPAADVQVRPRVSGYLQRVHFREGQIVQRGELLFTIDPAPFQAERDLASANVARAEALRIRAESEFVRARNLLDLNAISQEEFEARREGAAQAIAAKVAAQAALRATQFNVDHTFVRAPISGQISDARIHAGNLVRAAEDVLTTIVALDPIRFEFSAPEASLAGLRANASAEAHEVRLQLEGEIGFAHEGVLDFIDNAVDRRTGTIRGRATFANNGAFTSGQFGRLRILARETASAVLVPEAAIGADQTQRYVLVVDAENIVRRQSVELGPRLDDGLRVVRAGLSGDERVIVNGLQRAFPGARVTPETTVIAHNPPPAG